MDLNLHRLVEVKTESKKHLKLLTFFSRNFFINEMKKKLLYLYRGRFHKGYWSRRRKEPGNPIFIISGAIIIGYGCFFYIISENEYNIGKTIIINSSRRQRCTAFGTIKGKKKVLVNPGKEKFINNYPEYYSFIRLDNNKIIPNILIHRIIDLKDYKEVYD